MKKMIGLCAVMLLLFGSCVTAHKGIKSDLVGFSDDVWLSYLDSRMPPPNKVIGVGKNRPPYEIGEKEGYNQMRKTIFDMKPISENTSLYFAKDVARKRVRYVRRKFLTRDPEAKIYMLIMTDGLENSSLRAAKNHHMGHCCRFTEAYQKAVKRKTKRAMGKNMWQVYPIVFEGVDLDTMYKENHLSLEQQHDFITKQFEDLRGAKNAPLKGEDNISPQVIAARDVPTLASKFKEQFFSASFGFHIPKGYAGKTVKMTIKDSTKMNEIAEFSGVLMKKGGKYIFKDVEFKNGLIKCHIPSKGVWVATNKKNRKALVAKFEFNDFKIKDKALMDYKALIDKHNVEQRVYQQNTWVRNTEYDAQAGQSQNAYIITILDASRSVDEDYDEMKKALMKMISIAKDYK